MGPDKHQHFLDLSFPNWAISKSSVSAWAISKATPSQNAEGTPEREDIPPSSLALGQEGVPTAKVPYSLGGGWRWWGAQALWEEAGWR